MVRRYEEETTHDDQDSNQVPPDRDVVEDGDQAHAERVQQSVQEEDDGVHADDVGWVKRVAEELIEQGRREEGCSEVDAGRDSPLAQQIVPAGEPAPGSRVGPAELGRPVI